MLSAGHSSWPLQLACARQAGRQGAQASSWITNKIQTEAWQARKPWSQGQLRLCTELYSLGYYGLGKPESVWTSLGANANSFGIRERCTKTDNFAYSAFIIFSSRMEVLLQCLLGCFDFLDEILWWLLLRRRQTLPPQNSEINSISKRDHNHGTRSCHDDHHFWHSTHHLKILGTLAEQNSCLLKWNFSDLQVWKKPQDWNLWLLINSQIQSWEK